MNIPDSEGNMSCYRTFGFCVGDKGEKVLLGMLRICDKFASYSITLCVFIRGG